MGSGLVGPPVRKMERRLSPFSVWLFGFVGGFAGGVYLAYTIVVALFVVVPVFVLARQVLTGMAGFATGIGLISLAAGLRHSGECSGPAECDGWVGLSLTMGVGFLLASVLVSTLPIITSCPAEPIPDGY